MMKILVADDSRMARKMIRKGLKGTPAEAAEVFEAENGQQAIDLYKQEMPDIVFLDLTMPVKTGFEALEEIMAFDQNAKIFVVSGDVQQSAQEMVIATGALSFIKKPFNKTKVEEVLKPYIEQL